MFFRRFNRHVALLLPLLGGVSVSGVLSGQQVDIDRAYGTDIRPLLKRYCFECHSGKDSEAEINLDSFKQVADIRRATKVWLKVDDMLSSRQMPPRKSEQPDAEEYQKLLQWVQGFLTAEAREHAGDVNMLGQK